MKALALLVTSVLSVGVVPASVAGPSIPTTTTYHRTTVDGVGVFYREAGPKDAPTVVLLHGFPSSSREFDPLIPSIIWHRPRTVCSSSWV